MCSRDFIIKGVFTLAMMVIGVRMSYSEDSSFFVEGNVNLSYILIGFERIKNVYE